GERRGSLEPLLIGEALVPLPPVVPAGDLDAVVEAGEVGQGGGGVAAQRLFRRGELVEQDHRRRLAAAAPERPDGGLPYGEFQAGVLGDGVQAEDGRGVGLLGGRGGGGRGQGRRAAAGGGGGGRAGARRAAATDPRGERVAE